MNAAASAAIGKKSIVVKRGIPAFTVIGAGRFSAARAAAAGLGIISPRLSSAASRFCIKRKRVLFILAQRLRIINYKRMDFVLTVRARMRPILRNML
jgi:hypothetical protein